MGSVKGRIEAGSRRAKAAEELRGRARVQKVALAVLLKGMKRSLGSELRVEAQVAMPSACWAYAPSPCGSLALWELRGGESASRRARRPVA